MSVIDEIAAERRRQIEAEGWTPEHDDGEHSRGELPEAAACYALNAAGARHRDRVFQMWPWDFGWWKPKDARRDLIRAAALIVAEVERIDRAADSRSGSHT